jgi:hypothetical protein
MSPISLMSDEEKRNAFGSTGKATLRDWSKEETADAVASAKTAAAGAVKGASTAGAPGTGADLAKGKARMKGAGGGAMGAIFAKMKNISSEDREQLKSASPEEKAEIFKKAGLTEAEIEQMSQMRRNMGGGGGGGGRGFGGPGGGGGRGRPGGGEGGTDQ